MYSIQLLTSAVLTNLAYWVITPTVRIEREIVEVEIEVPVPYIRVETHTLEVEVIREVEVEVIVYKEQKKDPNGLIKNDLAKIEGFLPDPRWKPGVSLEELAHRHGMHALYKMICDKLVAKRGNT